VTGQEPAEAPAVLAITQRDGGDVAVRQAERASGVGDATDDALMLRFAAGDAHAFDILYARHRGPIYRFFLRQLGRADAEECHQEVWLKLIDARAAYQARGEFKAWLFTIAHRALTDRHRRQMKHAVTDSATEPDDVADPTHGPEQTAALRREAERLYRLIARLPFAQREVLLMKEQAGFSLADIARITGASEEGVKSRLRYAMQKLRQAATRA
jgi:RNA polymerase sigma factor (sigma-70 family)